MAGAIDLFSGSFAVSGTNLFKVDKDPLNEISAGIEDVVGKQADSTAGQFASALEAIIFSILGIPPDSPIAGILNGPGKSLTTFFTNFLAFAGELNPLDPNFNPQAGVNNFIQTMLKTSNMVSLLVADATHSGGVTGFIPMENLALDLIAGAVGTAQEVWDAILASVGVPAGSGTQAMTDQYFTDLLSMLANPDLTSALFDPVGAVKNFITDMLHPTNLLAPLVGGVVPGINIPGLDATKIISGVFTTGQIPGLDASKIVTGLFGAAQIPGLDATKIISGVITAGRIPNITAAMSTDMQAIVDGAYQAMHGGATTGNPVASFKTSLLNIPGVNIVSTILASIVPSLDATKITTGVFTTGLIPNLPASIITTGTFLAGQIPGLDATKIVSGVFTQGLIPSLTGAWGGTVAGSLINSVIAATVVPGLDATKIISGQFGVPQIPFLPASQITSGTFVQTLIPSLTAGWGGTIAGSLINSVIAAAVVPGLDATKIVSGQFPQSMLNITSIAASLVTGVLAATTIPGLDATKIISGVFTTGQIPGLPASQITSGTFLASLIPGLDATKIVSGVLATTAIPNITKAMSTDMQAMVDNIFQASNGGTSTGNTVASVKTSLLNIPGVNIVSTLVASVIPGLDATKITSGQFGTALIPNLPATIITSGIFGASQIPGLDATKIISGVFTQGLIPSLTGAWGGTVAGSLLTGSVAASLISGVLGATTIPGLDATKIVSGVLSTATIPNITKAMSTDMQLIVDYGWQAMFGGATTGHSLADWKTSLLNIPGANIVSTLLASVIPGLDATKIISGIFPQSMVNITNIPATVVSGVLAATNIPGLDASKIISGVFSNAMSPGLLPQTTWQASTTGGNNRVISPQFEDFTIPRTFFGFGGTGAAGGYSTAVARSGTRCYAITTSSLTSGQNEGVFLSPHTLGSEGGLTDATMTKVQPGQWWYGEIYVRAAAGNTATAGAVSMATYIKDSTGVNAVAAIAIASITVSGLPSSGWTKLGAWYQIPAGYDRVQPFAWVNAVNVANQTFYWDDAQFIEDTQAQAVTQKLWGGSAILTSILAAVIPGLDATKIVSGQFPQSMLNITSIAASLVTGVLAATNIPGLDTTKIISGTFANAMSPGLLPQTLWQATSQAGSNLIIGPDFEDSTVTRLVGSYNAPSDAVGSYSTAQKHGGTRSFALTTATANASNNDAVYFGVSTYGSVFDQQVRCQPGQWYYTEIYVLAKSTNTTTAGNIYLSLLVNDSTGVNAQLGPTLQAVLASGLSSSVWTKLSGWYQVPAGYDRICPFMGSNAQNVGAQTYYLDDVRFNEDTQAQAVTQKLFGGSAILNSVLAAVVPALDATKITTGVFGIPLIPNLPASIINTGVFTASQRPGLDATKIISGVLGAAQIPGLDASQIVSGQFPPWLTALIPVSSIGDTSPNLLSNPNYDKAISVLGEGVWVWDPSITHTTDGTGSVKVTANGTLRQLLSDPLIPVSLGQQLTLSHWLQWSAVTGSGNCFQISVVAYQNGLIQSDTPLQIVTGPAVNQIWMQLSGTYTVPIGVDAIRLELSVLPGATAGTIWWDEGSVTKTQRLAQSWTAGLVGDLSNLNSAVIARALQTDVISLVNSLGLGSYASVGSALSAITARLGNLGGTGLFDASKLGNIGGIPLLPSGAIPFLPASIINTGQFLAAQIPNLPATIINSGQFLATLIPGLDATKIISGVVGIAQVPTNLLGLSNITDLQAVVDGITNQFGGVNAAVSGSTQNLANAAMAGIFQTLTTNANLGQSMFSVTTGRSSAGSSFQVNFGQSSGPNLPAELSVTYSGLGSSTLGVANGLAHWNIVNDNDRSAIARYNVAPTLSDYQLVGGVLATLPAYNYLSGVSAAYYLFARMNVAGTSYDYAKFTTDGLFGLFCELGCVVGGTKTVFVAATRIPTNVQLWLAAGTPNGVRSYQVFGGTKPVVNYTEPGAASVIGAANRYWGFGGDFKKGTVFGSPPGDTLGVSAADNQPPSYQGSTFRCFRASGQIVLAAGHAVMPNNYWDGGVSRRSTDMVFDQASGTLTVNTEGTYLVNVRHAIQNLPNSQKMNAEVYVNGGLADLLAGEFADGFSGQSANGCAGVGIVYCFPGDTIRIGTYASNGSVSVLGESSGVSTYFEAALLNRS